MSENEGAEKDLTGQTKEDIIVEEKRGDDTIFAADSQSNRFMVESDSERVNIAMEVLADAKSIFKDSFPKFQDNVIISFRKGEKKESKKNIVFLGGTMTYREAYEDYATQIFNILIRAQNVEKSVGKGNAKKIKKLQDKKGVNRPWKEKRNIKTQEKETDDIKEQRGECVGKREMVDKYMNMIYHDFSLQSKEEDS